MTSWKNWRVVLSGAGVAAVVCAGLVVTVESASSQVLRPRSGRLGTRQAAPATQTAVIEEAAGNAEAKTDTERFNPKRRPTLFASLPDDMHNPDGMTVSDTTGTIFMAVPNFNGRPENKGPKLNPGFLVKVNMDGTVEKLLTFPVLESTGQCGPMGLDMGPDGNLYVCDNQYFFDADHKSRILRVVMDGDVPTGDVQVVADGLKLANAILWHNNNLFVTDTFLDLPKKFGTGGLWRFTGEEALSAGKDGKPAVKVAPNGTDPRLIAVVDVTEIDRGDNGGLDGMVAVGNTLYAGNFGDGALYAIRMRRNGNVSVETIHAAGEVISCVDGLFYDKEADRIYINDSQRNAIHFFKPTRRGEKAVIETIWENDDTDGSDGLLDQPCECVVIGKKMIIVNFDWTFPGLKNKAFDKPYTLSVIDLED